VLIGRAANADLPLLDDRVSRRHAYLQAVWGRLFFIDLSSRTGTIHEGRRRSRGWVGQGDRLGIGPFEIQPRWDVYPPTSPIAETIPVAGEGAVPGRDRNPAILLEISGNGIPTGQWRMSREVVLVGREATCRIRSEHPDASKYQCSLVRTPSGLWAVDLLSTGGTFVNGERIRSARLVEGDALQAGPMTIRLLSASEAPPRPSSRGNGAFPAPVLSPPVSAPASDGPTVGDILLQRPRGEDALVRTTEDDRFQQALVTVLGLFGQMHRDHMEIVREQLEQIRRLAEALEHQRGDPGRLDAPARQVSSPSETLDTAIQNLTRNGQAPALGLGATAGPPPREQPDLKEVQAMVTERLAALDRDQQAGWKKIVRALAGL
jgi:pSer/pThr/pTyr-binding forkhead associated (FHA) protein